MPRGRKYTCKKCKHKFHRREHNNICPECGTAGRIKRDPKKKDARDGSQVYVTASEENAIADLSVDGEKVVLEFQEPDTASEEKPETSRPITRVIRSPLYNANAAIWDEEKRIEMLFLPNQIIESDIWCPNCNRKLFECHTLMGRFSHRCGRCNYDITLIFP